MCNSYLTARHYGLMLNEVRERGAIQCGRMLCESEIRPSGQPSAVALTLSTSSARQFNIPSKYPLGHTKMSKAKELSHYPKNESWTKYGQQYKRESVKQRERDREERRERKSLGWLVIAVFGVAKERCYLWQFHCLVCSLPFLLPPLACAYASTDRAHE